MMEGFGWARNPIIKRMDQMNEDIPITILYGSRSWVANSAGETIKKQRLNSYVNVQVNEKKKKRIYYNIVMILKLIIYYCHQFYR